MNPTDDLKTRVIEFDQEHKRLLDGVLARIRDILDGYETEKQIVVNIPVKDDIETKVRAYIRAYRLKSMWYQLHCHDLSEIWVFTFEKMPLYLLRSIAKSLVFEHTWTIEAKQKEGDKII